MVSTMSDKSLRELASKTIGEIKLKEDFEEITLSCVNSSGNRHLKARWMIIWTMRSTHRAAMVMGAAETAISGSNHSVRTLN